MRRISSAFQAVIAVLALCLPAAALAEEPAAVAGQTPTTVTDIAGREVTVNAPVKRILLGEGRQLYLIASLEPKDPLARIVAWRNDLIEADPATYAQYLEAFPKLAKLPAFPGQENGLLDIESTIVSYNFV